MNRKRVLFIYDEMMIGGTTTSLLSILNLIDYTKFDVDLLLYSNKGVYFKDIPEKVNILTQAEKPHTLRASISTRKLLLTLCNGGMFRLIYYMIRCKKYNIHDIRMLLMQIARRAQVTLSRKLTKKYDVAVAFREEWALEYLVTKKIVADRKIAWIHLDYVNSYLIPQIDRNIHAQLNNIVLVSQKCKESFDYIFPEHLNKSIVIENILTKNIIEEKCNKYTLKIDLLNSCISFVTVCRVFNEHKGLDRALRAFLKLRNNGVLRDISIKWYIIGDGPDLETNQRFVRDNKLSDSICFLGPMTNPLPYVKQASALFLPSRFEGKPMAVTEALLAGTPCVVTDFLSARELITNGVDGLILPNDENGIYEGIAYVINHPEVLTNMREQIKQREYSNFDEIMKVEAVLEGIKQ